MDLLSTYGVLQHNRHILNLPYFTLREFCSALLSKESGSMFLMQTVLNMLLLKLNIRPPFLNSGNQAIQFYNHPQSKSKKLEIMSKFQAQKDMSFEAILELINQMVNVILSTEYQYRVDGSGAFMKQEGDNFVLQKGQDDLEEIQSFFSLGVDFEGNEYYVLYPDIILVISPHETLPYVENPIGYEPWLAEMTKLETSNIPLYANLSEYLQVSGFHLEEGNQLNIGFQSQNVRDNAKFYNFDQHNESKGIYYEDCRLLVDNICKQIQDSGFKEFVDLVDNVGGVSEIYEASHDSEDDDYSQTKKKKQSVITEKKLIQDQVKLFAHYNYEKPKQLNKNFEIASQLATAEISYVNILQNSLVKFQPFGFGIKGLKRQDIFQHYIYIGQDKLLIDKIVDYVQFQTINLLRSVAHGDETLNIGKSELSSKNFTHAKTIIGQQLDHVFSICHGIVDFYYDFSDTLKQHKYYYDLDNFSQFKELSKTDNSMTINPLEVADDYIIFKFTRFINIDVGSKAILQQYPLFVRNKTSFPRSEQCQSMRIYLGFELPKVEVIVQELPEPSSSSSPYEYEEESDQKPRRRGSKYYDFSDEDYVSEYYDAMPSDEYNESSSTSTDKESSTLWEVNEINISEYDQSRMEIVDQYNNLLNPQVFNQEFMSCRIWSNPEDLRIEREKRQKQSERKQKQADRAKNPPQLIRKKRKVRRQKQRGRRSNQIVVTQETMQQYAVMSSWVEKQRKEMEALKARVMQSQQMQQVRGTNVQQAARLIQVQRPQNVQQPVPVYGIPPSQMQYQYQQQPVFSGANQNYKVPNMNLSQRTNYHLNLPLAPEIKGVQMHIPPVQPSVNQQISELPNPKELKKTLAKMFTDNYEREFTEKIAQYLDNYDRENVGRRGRIPDAFYVGLRQIFKDDGWVSPKNYFDRKDRNHV